MAGGTETGVVCAIENTKMFGEKGFRVRVFVIEKKEPKWTNYIPFTLTGDRCDRADDLNIGDKIEVAYNLAGRKYTKSGQEDRYFLNAEASSYKMIAKSDKPKQQQSQDDENIPF